MYNDCCWCCFCCCFCCNIIQSSQLLWMAALWYQLKCLNNFCFFLPVFHLFAFFFSTLALASRVIFKIHWHSHTLLMNLTILPLCLKFNYIVKLFFRSLVCSFVRFVPFFFCFQLWNFLLFFVILLPVFLCSFLS